MAARHASLDEFNGTDVAAPPWEVVRRDQTLTVGSAARCTSRPQQGDIYGDVNTAKNLVLRARADGRLDGDDQGRLRGHRPVPPGGHHPATPTTATSSSSAASRPAATGDEKFEFIQEVNGTPRNEAADSTANVPANFPKDYYLRMVSDGTNVTGAYSTDGTTWTPVGRPAPIPAGAKIGMFAFNNAAATSPVADFDWFRLEGPGGGHAVRPEPRRRLLRRRRWTRRAGTRSCARTRPSTRSAAAT